MGRAPVDRDRLWSAIHLERRALARTGRVHWIRSFAGALFDTDRHNRRRLAEQLGSTPEATLENFLLSSGLRVAPFGDVAAWLGETIVHAEDIRRPLGLRRDYPMDALTSVARFYAARDFAVNSATVAADLRLRATDGPFEAGNGPAVEGPTLALVMAMAGRPAYLEDLSGDGVGELRRRIG